MDRINLRVVVTSIVALIVFALVAWGGWESRQMWHGIVMVAYQYPLLTWVPIGIPCVVGIAALIISRLMDARDPEDNAVVAFFGGAAIGVGVLVISALFIAPWSGKSTYESHTYTSVNALPQSTIPRLMPKGGAQWQGLASTHLAIDPSTNTLVWSGDREPGGIFKRGESGMVYTQPLNQVDGEVKVYGSGYKTALSQVGPGSLKWRAYGRHYFTKITDPVIVPTGDGRSIVVAPYLGYRGLLVKKAYLKGVYVMHQDGKLEDLSPEEARKRPELVKSGRIFPEVLAKNIAKAYGYKDGIKNTLWTHKDHLKVADFGSNPQPYLTQLGDGRVVWMTVMTKHSDDNVIGAVLMTDASKGSTTVWKPPTGTNLLSNSGATKLAHSLPLQWSTTVCCDADGYEYSDWVRTAEEARLVFKDGKPYYLVSIFANPAYVAGATGSVERTVVVDAVERSIVEEFNHQESSEADDRLRTFFNPEPAVATAP